MFTDEPEKPHAAWCPACISPDAAAIIKAASVIQAVLREVSNN